MRPVPPTRRVRVVAAIPAPPSAPEIADVVARAPCPRQHVVRLVAGMTWSVVASVLRGACGCAAARAYADEIAQTSSTRDAKSRTIR